MFTIETNENFLALKSAVQEQGFPTGNKLASDLWAWSNNPNTCVALAANVFEALGYRAFAGFPLVRNSTLCVRNVYFRELRVGWIEKHGEMFMAFRCWGKWYPGQACGMFAKIEDAEKRILAELKDCQ